MSWKQLVKELELPNEQQFLELLKRNPCEPLIYVLKVQDKTEIEAFDYYNILIEKYKEEKNEKLLKIVEHYAYLMRDR